MVSRRRTPTCAARRTQAAHRARSRGGAQYHRALSAVLCLTNAQRLPTGIEQHITPAQIQHLTRAHPCFPQDGEDQKIRWRRAGDRHVQCALFLLLADTWQKVGTAGAAEPEGSSAGLFERLVARAAPAALDSRQRAHAVQSAEAAAGVLRVLWSRVLKTGAESQSDAELLLGGS